MQKAQTFQLKLFSELELQSFNQHFLDNRKWEFNSAALYNEL